MNCGNANGGCEHYCNNTVGSFTCSCNTGFELAEDNLNCTGKELQLTIGIWDCFTSLACVHADVDECAANTDRCAQTLLVAIGVVVVHGYTLNSDGLTCDGKIMLRVYCHAG